MKKNQNQRKMKIFSLNRLIGKTHWTVHLATNEHLIINVVVDFAAAGD